MVKDFLSGNLLQSVSSEVQCSAEAAGLVQPVRQLRPQSCEDEPALVGSMGSWG